MELYLKPLVKTANEHAARVGCAVMTVIRALIGGLILCALCTACRRGYEWTDLRRGATNCVIAVFPKEATDHQINAVLATHTEGPKNPGGGHSLREGIGSLIARDVDGLVGYEICFSPDKDPKLRAGIVEELKRSPGLERVVQLSTAEQATDPK
jgi:hypothetical protein